MNPEETGESPGTQSSAHDALTSIRNGIGDLARLTGHDLSRYSADDIAKLGKSFTKNELDRREADRRDKAESREHVLKATVIISMMVLVGFVAWASFSFSSPAKRDDVIHDWMAMLGPALLGILAGFGLGRKH